MSRIVAAAGDDAASAKFTGIRAADIVSTTVPAAAAVDYAFSLRRAAFTVTSAIVRLVF